MLVVWHYLNTRNNSLRSQCSYLSVDGSEAKRSLRLVGPASTFYTRSVQSPANGRAGDAGAKANPRPVELTGRPAVFGQEERRLKSEVKNFVHQEQVCPLNCS